MKKTLSVFAILALTQAIEIDAASKTEVATTTEASTEAKTMAVAEAECPACGNDECVCDGGHGSLCGQACTTLTCGCVGECQCDQKHSCGCGHDHGSDEGCSLSAHDDNGDGRCPLSLGPIDETKIEGCGCGCGGAKKLAALKAALGGEARCPLTGKLLGDSHCDGRCPLTGKLIDVDHNDEDATYCPITGKLIEAGHSAPDRCPITGKLLTGEEEIVGCGCGCKGAKKIAEKARLAALEYDASTEIAAI